jgi:hypothetical protein
MLDGYIINKVLAHLRKERKPEVSSSQNKFLSFHQEFNYCRFVATTLHTALIKQNV